MADVECGPGAVRARRSMSENLHLSKRTTLHTCFQALLLLGIGCYILCYYLSDSVPWWNGFSLQEQYEKVFGRNIPPTDLSYSIHPDRTKFWEAIEETSTSPPSVTDTTTSRANGTLYHHAYPQNYNFIMDNTDACKNNTPFLVLLVAVASQNTEARDAIRMTWAAEKQVQGEVVLTFFMLGLPKDGLSEQLREKLEQENLQHHDLIQSTFVDSYLNLTTKTMVMMDWLATHCRSAAYGMKIDSDMFLNIDNLVKMLKLPNIPKENYLTGLLMLNREAIRDKNSKWFVPKELYPHHLYPTYALGMGYVFSNDLPSKYVEASKKITPFNIEDAYIGMCMKILDLKLTPPPNPWQFQSYSGKYDRCQYSKVITYILGSAKQLIQYWTDLKKPGDPCETS